MFIYMQRSLVAMAVILNLVVVGLVVAVALFGRAGPVEEVQVVIQDIIITIQIIMIIQAIIITPNLIVIMATMVIILLEVEEGQAVLVIMDMMIAQRNRIE